MIIGASKLSCERPTMQYLTCPDLDSIDSHTQIPECVFQTQLAPIKHDGFFAPEPLLVKFDLNKLLDDPFRAPPRTFKNCQKGDYYCLMGGVLKTEKICLKSTK